MRILSATWASQDNTAVSLLVSDSGNLFAYTANETDSEPLNKYLWDMAMENKDSIKTPDAYRMINGEIPLRDDLMITAWNGELAPTEGVRLEAKKQVEQEFNRLMSPRNIAMARIDPEKAKELDFNIKALLGFEAAIDPENVEAVTSSVRTTASAREESARACRQ
ncbi:MAG: hypothetical protein FWC70_07740 [Defluviitaleaceae bacterium]|nr:hypothetical protein [Defluviitaleaceae bacterium]